MHTRAVIQVSVDRHDAARLIDALRIASGEERVDPAVLRRHYPTTAARYTLLADTLGDALDGLALAPLPPAGPDAQLTECEVAERISAHPRGEGGRCGACGPDSGPWERHLARALLA